MAPSWSSLSSVVSHAWALALYMLVFCWVFAALLFTDAYLAESDLQDVFLPVFLSPVALWSSDVFAGFPVFADPFDATPYPVHLLFARVLHSWAGYVISAYVLGASFMYAYVFTITRSRAAAFVAGLAFGLSQAMIERQAHINILHAFAWVPLIVLSVDRLISGGSRRWIALGAAAVASCMLAGHPQPLLYTVSFCLVYTLAGGLAGHAPPIAYARTIGMFLLGFSITAVKSFPFLEAARYAARDVVGFERFLTSSHTPLQLLGALFPAIEYSGREAPLYVGLAVLSLAGLGLTSRWTWRARVWAGAATFAVLVSIGDATPAARLAYELPLYDRFRVVSRILILFAAGAATLAGFGVAELQRRERSRAAVMTAVAAMIVALAAGAVLLAALPGRVSFVPGESHGWNLPVWNDTVWAQFGFGAASAACILWLWRARRFWPAVAALSLVVSADLLESLPYPVTPAGLVLNVLGRDDLLPSVHAAGLAERIRPARERLLALGGTTRDPLVPAGFARLWGIPIAGGYSQLLPGGLAAIAEMGINGDVREQTLTLENRALDLLAVRYVTTEARDVSPGPTFEQRGITWTVAPLDLPIGRADCGQLYPRTVSMPLPATVEIASIALVAHLRCGDQVAKGVEAGRIEVTGPSGTVVSRPLVVGVDLSDRDLNDPPTRERARHGPADLFEDPSLAGHQSFLRLDLPQPIRGGRLVLHGAAIHAWTSLERLTLLDPRGRSLPQRLSSLLVAGPDRWQEWTRFRTSRITDRGRDEASPAEREVVVYENRRVLPRAWIVPQVIGLAEGDLVAAVHHSQMPDGRPFDPREVAIVESAAAPAVPSTSRSSPEAAIARVTSIEDGRLVVEVSSVGGGFLVLSETFYPGWRARIGSRIETVYRTNGTLQGVPVPAGQHTVVFELMPLSLWLGAAVSLLAVVAAVRLLWRG